MFDNEVLILKEDKEELLYHIQNINKILNRYPYQACNGHTVTNMSRAKNAAQDTELWINSLYTQ